MGVTRDPCTGKIIEFREQKVSRDQAGTNSRNSSSMRRALDPPEVSFRGSASNFPFWPGGFDLPPVEVEGGLEALDFSPEKLLSCPPGLSSYNKTGVLCQQTFLGFDHGIDFYRLRKESPHAEDIKESSNILNLADFLNQKDSVFDLFTDKTEGKSEKVPNTTVSSAISEEEDGLDIDQLDTDIQVLSISEGNKPSQPTVTKWAEMLDAEAPLSDFHQQVPQMAFSWPFELDTFQKQAVLKLEQAESVFVAAHTSAGECSTLHYYPLLFHYQFLLSRI